jgi:hypothetical protein
MLAFGGLCLAIFIVSLVIVVHTGSVHLAAAIARTDRLDPDWRLQDLEGQGRPFPPKGKNGMDQVLAIRAAAPPGGYGQWEFLGRERNSSELVRLRDAMQNSLNGNRKVPAVLNEDEISVLQIEERKSAKGIGLARELVNCPYGRFDVIFAKNFWSTNFGPMHEIRATANLLRYDALRRANQRDITGALENVNAMLHASRSVGNQRILITTLDCVSVDRLAVMVLERTLGLGEGTDKELLELQKELLAQSKIPYFLIGLRGERAGIDLLLESIQTGELKVDELAALPAMKKLPGPLAALWLFYTNMTIKDRRAELLSLMTDAVEIARAPLETHQAELKTWQEKHRHLDTLSITRYLIPALTKADEWDIQLKAELRCAIAGIAAERFRLASGHWPGRLEDLVPRFLDQVPVDPYDGQPLKMTRREIELVIYAIGLDSTDNGGQIDDSPNLSGSDIGFRLFDPAKRRQPARPFLIKKTVEE